MYHVIGTAITVSALYLISYIFYRTGLYSLASHRRLWNTILAVTFIITALAGLFMALQINFKWNIPGIKSILKWHVETGAGMAITGIFHFIWHLSYFKKIFSRTEEPSELKISPEMSSVDISINLFLIGFTSMSVQILLIREIMNISGGYELTTGIFLGSWLVTSGIGASAASKSSLNDLRRINLMFSISPLASLVLLILLSRLFLQTGQTPSFLVSIIFTFLVLVPFCIVSGFSFVKLIAAARKVNMFIPGKSFSIETIGGITAGIILSVLTAGLLDTYQLLLTIIALSLAYTILTFFVKGRRMKFIVKLLIAILAAFILSSGPDNFFRHLLLPGVKVTETKDTPYGNITFGEYSGEKSIYYNQRLLAYNDDVAEREENIHYALLQNKNPEKVLLISGSLKSNVQEILKYPVSKILYIERDPELIKSVSEKVNPGNTELIIVNRDAFRYLKGENEKFDAVLLLLPPPSTLSLNRYYTIEFFNDVKKRLNPDGVFMCSPGIWDNYPNNASVNFYSSVYNSLTAVFKNVEPIAGNKLYFIASDAEVSVSVCKLAEERKINNVYVCSDFLADDLIESKSSEILSLLDKGARKNSLLFPVASLHFQSYNFSKDVNEKIPSIILMIVVFALPVLTVSRRNLLMYCSASAMAGFEIIILLFIQLTVGNMYQFTGIILAALMAGLAAGAGMNSKFLNSIKLKTKALFIAIYYAIIALGTGLLVSVNSIIAAVLVIILSVLLPSFLTGHIFRELTISDSDGSDSAVTYSSDLAGSAFGFILISGIAIPLIGLKASIFLLSGLIFAGILLGTNRNK
jgi:spermidine synthase